MSAKTNHIDSPGVLTRNTGPRTAPTRVDPSEILGVARVAHERQKEQENLDKYKEN